MTFALLCMVCRREYGTVEGQGPSHGFCSDACVVRFLREQDPEHSKCDHCGDDVDPADAVLDRDSNLFHKACPQTPPTSTDGDHHDHDL